MVKLIWDKTGERFYETGVSKGVLYPASNENPGEYDKGVVWNGLSSVTESPTGAEVSPIYSDNIKYLNLMSVEEFEATIEAYTYPDEFAACDGSAEVEPDSGMFIKQQNRKLFGFSYQTKIGNDSNPDLGFKIHIIYGALASPSERAYETVNDSPEAMTFSWEISTTPVEITGFKPSACIEIDSTKTDPTKLATLMDILYGKDEVPAVIGDGTPEEPEVPAVPAVDPRLLLPDEIALILKTT